MMSLLSFCALIVVISLIFYERVRELSDSIKNILICVPKINEVCMVFERHESE